MSLQERLKKIRKDLKIGTQANLATIMQVKPDRIKSLETGRVKDISVFEANELVKNFNLSLDWILTGKGSMLNTSTTQPQSDLVQVPYYSDVYAAAGDGAINYTTQPTFMSFDIDFLKAKLRVNSLKGLHVIKALGDSMHPTINSTDMLFITPFENENHKIRDKDIYIINTPNGVLVKRVQIHPIKAQYTLISDNPKDENIVLQGDELQACQIIGRVVGSISINLL